MHAIPSKLQAEAAEGNIAAYTTSRNGIQHTLTVWTDQASMRRYLINGAHRQAMKVADVMSLPGSGTKVYGYESETIPTWDEALALWDQHGTRHGKKVVAATTKSSSLSRYKGGGLLAIGAVSVTLAMAVAARSILGPTSSRTSVA
eukprot:scaffold44815_cov214-Amphora_coffeaeformis.AAC.1